MQHVCDTRLNTEAKNLKLFSMIIQQRFQEAVNLRQQGRLAEAGQVLQLILEQEPTYIDALHQLGLIAIAEGKLDWAIELMGRAISLRPGYAEAYNDQAIALRKLRRPAEALDSYDMAIALKPNFAMAFNNRANALTDLKRPAEALNSCDRAIELAPNLPLAHYNRGVALSHLARFEEAVKSYDKAIALKPDFAIAYQNRGHSLNQLQSYEEAIAAYREAFSLQPNLIGAEGDYLYTKIRICDWRELEAGCKRLVMNVESGNANTSPFPLLAIPSSSAQQLQCSRLWVKNNSSISDSSTWEFGRWKNDRIGIGIFRRTFTSTLPPI